MDNRQLLVEWLMLVIPVSFELILFRLKMRKMLHEGWGYFSNCLFITVI